MDIPVSRLNKRMALQLPAEFPLGLVFVVGRVRDLTNIDSEDDPAFFHIYENGYRLRCQLTERALEGITLNDGDMIRAGGHLAFDTLQADYFLLARDIEVLAEQRPVKTALDPILADIKKRSEAASLVPAELPDWVQQIAPPEIREAIRAAERDDAAEVTAEKEAPIEPDTKPVEEVPEVPEEEPLPDGLTNDLVQFLSEAMDSSDDVELTEEMVAGLAPETQPKEPQVQPAQPYDVIDAEPAETRVPWSIVIVAVLFMISVLALILLMAVLATRLP